MCGGEDIYACYKQFFCVLFILASTISFVANVPILRTGFGSYLIVVCGNLRYGIWTPGALLAGFIKRTTIHCYTQNMKALGLVVSEKIF